MLSYVRNFDHLLVATLGTSLPMKLVRIRIFQYLQMIGTGTVACSNKNWTKITSTQNHLLLHNFQPTHQSIITLSYHNLLSSPIIIFKLLVVVFRICLMSHDDENKHDDNFTVRIYFIRHGETIANVAGIVCGRTASVRLP